MQENIHFFDDILLFLKIIHFFHSSFFPKFHKISKKSKIEQFPNFLSPTSPYISQSSVENHVQTPGQIFPESSNGIFNIDPNPSQHYFQISLNFRPNLSKASPGPHGDGDGGRTSNPIPTPSTHAPRKKISPFGVDPSLRRIHSKL